MLDPIVKAFQAEVSKVRLNEPSNSVHIQRHRDMDYRTRGDQILPIGPCTPITQPGSAMPCMSCGSSRIPILLEAGPGRTLGVLAMQHPDRQDAGDPVAVSSIRHHYENQSDVEFLWHGIGRLWLSGIEIKWDNVHTGGRRRRVPLPTYPFERQNYWMEAKSGSAKKSHRAESGIREFRRGRLVLRANLGKNAVSA